MSHEANIAEIAWVEHKCIECNRIFDMWNETDVNEWFYGHDC